jgi:hypothetical protein
MGGQGRQTHIADGATSTLIRRVAAPHGEPSETVSRIVDAKIAQKQSAIRNVGCCHRLKP